MSYDFGWFSSQLDTVFPTKLKNFLLKKTNNSATSEQHSPFQGAVTVRP
jgi:hypothetical protein